MSTLPSTAESTHPLHADVVSARVDAGGGHLVLELGDGGTVFLPAALLWRECPSAQGKVRRLKGLAIAPAGLTIVAFNPIGHYGVNIAFSDGHARGIYPWSYLQMLTRQYGV